MKKACLFLLIFSVVYFTGCEFKPTAVPIVDAEDIKMTVRGPISAAEFCKTLVDNPPGALAVRKRKL